jgi:Putative Ig domain
VTSASLSAGPTPLTIAGPTYHVGEVGLAYAPVTIAAAGGNPPYLWTVSTGALPGGLTISPAGVVSGTPTASGGFNFTVEVNDTAGTSANLASTIDIAPRLTAGIASSGTIAIRQGSAAANRAFAYQTGGSPPYTYSVTSGSLPTGTGLNGLSLSGTYGAAGTYHFTVTVTDGLGAAATVSPSFYIWGPIAFPPSHCDTQQCTADHTYDAIVYPYGFDVTLTGTYTYTGGTPGATPRVSFSSFYWGGSSTTCTSGGCPLNGVTVTAVNGVVTVTVAGGQNPNLGHGWWRIGVTLTDPVTGESTRTAQLLVSA